MNEHRLEVADVFRQHGEEFLKRWGHTVSPQQRKALRDIGACRNPGFKRSSDAFGTAGGSVTFPAGIVLERPGIFCILLTDSNNFDHLTAVVHGFLANDK